ncbi:tubulin monoglycylase TTLL3-like [Lycorma delicatula]|uniref:tubulin monoglycylase TTLL3-like n=1 Tax=Lycorma delicatula TaxID=130591 RepID=UPI003F514ECD
MQMKLAVHISKTIQQKKIFAMGCTNFSTIRNNLIKRGWIQKFACEELSLKTGAIPQDPEAQLTQRMLRNVPINFIWVYTVSDWSDIKPHTVVNRFPRASASYSFTTKIGLNHNLEQSYWFYESGIANVDFPRTYSILTQEDMLGFIEDYVMTACTCLLKLVVGSVIRGEHDLLKDGDVPQNIIDFAINRCNEYVAFREHRDIDSKKAHTSICDQTVKDFLKNFYKIVHEGETFETSSYLQVQGLYLAAKSALQGIQRFWPQMKLDGYKNLWLLKQSNLNCGKGVQILNTLEEIIEAVGEVRSPRYVIQKYIERPLLIYDTKFDIRQWILLTSVNPIQIWMYNECYLRFSSQVFSLSDTSESVHLCNNVIQRRYKNAKRHPNLPVENMWDSITFQKYLVDIGEPDKWETVIFPGMKQCVIATVMSAQEDMIERVNSFELYGVDFMLTEDFKPWLIEVNSSPAMGPTTSVTSRLCSQCLSDVIKVVVDRRANPNADTGQFTLIYKQESLSNAYALASDVAVIGKKMVLHKKKGKYSNNGKTFYPVVDIRETAQGKMFCIEDSPSKCVMSILTQKNDILRDKFEKEYKQDDKNMKSERKQNNQSVTASASTSNFIKNMILTYIVNSSCSLVSSNGDSHTTKSEASSSNDLRQGEGTLEVKTNYGSHLENENKFKENPDTTENKLDFGNNKKPKFLPENQNKYKENYGTVESKLDLGDSKPKSLMENENKDNHDTFESKLDLEDNKKPKYLPENENKSKENHDTAANKLDLGNNIKPKSLPENENKHQENLDTTENKLDVGNNIKPKSLLENENKCKENHDTGENKLDFGDNKILKSLPENENKYKEKHDTSENKVDLRNYKNPEGPADQLSMMKITKCSSSKKKTIQYKIYYNREKTHFVVDVQEEK